MFSSLSQYGIALSLYAEVAAKLTVKVSLCLVFKIPAVLLSGNSFEFLSCLMDFRLNFKHLWTRLSSNVSRPVISSADV